MVAPKQGDIIWIDAEPHAGREEGGHNPQSGNIQRPAIVISNNAYNQKQDSLSACLLRMILKKIIVVYTIVLLISAVGYLVV
ncbi:type II toxin-antitoxin system PemK/MazF family toxin [Lactobacillus sp. R2/2]|nr:type II toxin-antitoxin system PemK/MazF family toxin [Lactobacillus sp. R2/2]